MRIEENTLKHWIDNFYGYGSWDARIWFIAYEESGGDLPEEEAEAVRLNGPGADLLATFYDYRLKQDLTGRSLVK